MKVIQNVSSNDVIGRPKYDPETRDTGNIKNDTPIDRKNTIEVRAKDAVGIDGLGVQVRAKHLFIVYTNDQGQQSYLAGYPHTIDPKPLRPQEPWGDIVMKGGEYTQNSPDWKPYDVIATVKGQPQEIQALYEQLKEQFQRIQNAHIEYWAHDQNSNSTAMTALRNVGLQIQLPKSEPSISTPEIRTRQISIPLAEQLPVIGNHKILIPSVKTIPATQNKVHLDSGQTFPGSATYLMNQQGRVLQSAIEGSSNIRVASKAAEQTAPTQVVSQNSSKEPLQAWKLRELNPQIITSNPQSQAAISITAAQVARDWLQQQGKSSSDGRTLVATGNHYEAAEDQQTRTLTFSRVQSGGERSQLLTLNRQTGELSLEQPFSQEDINRLQGTQQLLAQAQLKMSQQLAQTPALEGR